MAFEIERKYLIEYPDINLLEKYADSKSEIAQTYLKTDNGLTSRVRKRTTDGVTKYIFTEKKRITDVNASRTSEKLVLKNMKSS
jgi:CYTH domain-containing protein